MTLGSRPDLFAAIMEALQGLDWAMGVHVTADDQARGYRVTVSVGDRFLTHTRQIIVPTSTTGGRDVAHTVRVQIADMKRDLDRVTSDGETK